MTLELAKKNASNDVREKLERFSQQVILAKNNFMVALLLGNYQKAKTLMENRPIDINANLTGFGDTILMRVADQGSTEEVKLLLKHHNINVNIQDGIGITALIIRKTLSGHKFPKWSYSCDEIVIRTSC